MNLGYYFTFWFPEKFVWLIPSMDAYHAQIISLKVLTIIQLIVLIRKLWSFKSIPKSDKQFWTGMMIVFSSIASLVFIWKKVDQFENQNNKASL